MLDPQDQSVRSAAPASVGAGAGATLRCRVQAVTHSDHWAIKYLGTNPTSTSVDGSCLVDGSGLRAPRSAARFKLTTGDPDADTSVRISATVDGVTSATGVLTVRH